MTKLNKRQKCLLRIITIAFGGAMYFSWLLWLSATAADIPLLLSLYHDTNHDGQRQSEEPAASDYAYALSWTNGTQSLSATGITDANGMIATRVTTGTWTVSGDALSWQITVDGDVVGAGVQDVGVGRHGLWLPVVWR